MWQYAVSKKVALPTDSKRSAKLAKERPPPSDGRDQLEAVKAHIEDLGVVIERVKRSDEEAGYMSPLLSELSELRLDY